MKYSIQPASEKNKASVTIRDIVICGLFSAVLFVVQVGLAVLPNVELVSLLVIVYTLVFGRKTIPMIYIFALLEGVIYGFGIWWIMYLYVWTILYGIARVLRKNESPLFWAVVGGFYGLSYGALCSVPYLVLSGMGVGIAWWIRGIPFDIIHGVANFIVILVLFKPVYSVMKKLN